MAMKQMNGNEATIAEWSGLVDATRCALASLECDELERLASRAERMLDEQQFQTTSFDSESRAMRSLVEQKRVLGWLLDATGRNLALLRRLSGREGDGRWQH